MPAHFHAKYPNASPSAVIVMIAWRASSTRITSQRFKFAVKMTSLVS